MNMIVLYFVINIIITAITFKDFESLSTEPLSLSVKILLCVVMTLLALPLLILGKVTKMIRWEKSFKDIKSKIK